MILSGIQGQKERVFKLQDGEVLIFIINNLNRTLNVDFRSMLETPRSTMEILGGDMGGVRVEGSLVDVRRKGDLLVSII